MLEGKTFDFYDSDTRVRFPGLTFGYGDSNPHVIAKTDHFMVIHRHPTQGWKSLGRKGHVPSKFWLLEIEKISESRHRVIQSIICQTPGRSWKVAQKSLIASMTTLQHAYESRSIAQARPVAIEGAHE